MFALWYLSLAIDEYRRSPDVNKPTEPKANSSQAPRPVPAEKNDKLVDIAKSKPQKTDIVVPPKTQPEIAQKLPDPVKPIEKPKPAPAKDPFDAKLAELSDKKTKNLPTSDPLDAKLAELTNIKNSNSNDKPVDPFGNLSADISIKDPFKPLPTAKSPTKAQTEVKLPNIANISKPQIETVKDAFDNKTQVLKEPFEAKLAEFPKDTTPKSADKIQTDPFDTKPLPKNAKTSKSTGFEGPNANTFNQFEDPMDKKFAELSSKYDKSFNNTAPIQKSQYLQEDPLDQKLRELSTKFNETLGSPKNVFEKSSSELSDQDSTFEDLSTES